MPTKYQDPDGRGYDLTKAVNDRHTPEQQKKLFAAGHTHPTGNESQMQRSVTLTNGTVLKGDRAHLDYLGTPTRNEDYRPLLQR